MPDLILRDVDPADFTEMVTADVVAAIRLLLAEAAEPRLVDGDRLAELLSVSRPTIDRGVRDGTIPSVLVGRRRLYEPRAVIDALAAQTETKKATAANGDRDVPTSDGRTSE